MSDRPSPPNHPYRPIPTEPLSSPELTTFEKVDEIARVIRAGILWGACDRTRRSDLVRIYEALEDWITHGTRWLGAAQETLAVLSVMLPLAAAIVLNALPADVKFWVLTALVGILAAAGILRIRLKYLEAILVRGREACAELQRYLAARTNEAPDVAPWERTGVRADTSASPSGLDDAEDVSSTASSLSKRERR